MGTQDNRTQRFEQLSQQLGGAPLAQLPISIYVADAQGRLAFCNAEARMLLDLPAENGLSGSITDFYRDPDQYAALVEAVGLPEAGSGRPSAQRTLVPLVVSGRDVYVEQTLNGIPCEPPREGRLFVGCMVDVTDGHIDASSAIHGLSQLGIASLEMGNSSVTQTITQSLGWSGDKDRALTTARSQALFEIGKAAIAHQEMLAAMKVLDGLASLIHANAPAAGELARDTIGLFAHLWTSGETGRQFARFRLSQLESHFLRDTAAVVDATIEHCSLRALFETADKVRIMRRELASSAAEAAEGA